MKEIVIISGKGGTGKTSLCASFAMLAGGAVLADCDVDASDLHLLLAPQNIAEDDFVCGHKAEIDPEKCIACGACLAHCRFEAVKMKGDVAGESKFSIDELNCEGCGVCVKFCPVSAINFPEKLSGKSFVSKTKAGYLSHAMLFPGSGNSGKLVAKVREKARQIAREHGRNLILCDGPPGVGCPVIASLTGASFVVVVTEPTLSGLHDMERVLKLISHFGIPAAVCINKFDINIVNTERIEEEIKKYPDVLLSARISYDEEVRKALLNGKTVVETRKGIAVTEIREFWKSLKEKFDKK
jgi:MinD superfamily P-loop ATPase